MVVTKNVEKLRTQRIYSTAIAHKALYGQYLTPNSIASFMSKLLIDYSSKRNDFRILDPGAGQGILGISLIESLYKENKNIQVSLDTYEIDDSIKPDLMNNLELVSHNYGVQWNLFEENFIDKATQDLGWSNFSTYTHIIMNPPYKKLNVDSVDHRHLKELGVETTNYYSAFISLSILMLEKNGLLAAIVPRSFCNGKYFLNFRKLILKETSIVHIHTFDSRTDSFKEEGVLQENIILVLKKDRSQPAKVNISSSSDRNLTDYQLREIEFINIVTKTNSELYFNIPKENCDKNILLSSSLEDLGVKVSTGPIVDFRVRDKLRENPEEETIPLLYPVHFKNGRVNWPVNSKKPNAIFFTKQELEKTAYKSGYYVIVKRFSSKEEKRRIWPSLISPNDMKNDYFTVENHLNIFHVNKDSLNEFIATGLFVFLSTEFIDNQFRNFSGHTQVNATDLKQIKYPNSDQLTQIAQIYIHNPQLSFDDILIKVVSND